MVPKKEEVAVKRLILITATLALGACQTAAPSYRAAGGPNSAGYFSAPVDGGRQAVTYTGEKGMTSAQVAEYALLRAAELTLASGQEWFAVLHTASQKVQASDVNNIAGRSGAVLTSESTTAGAGGGGDRSTAAAGVGDGSVPGGPSTGGFGGGDVPYQVLERWTPPTVPQTTIIVQMGSGQEASFENLETAPEIYSAQAVADQIRAKMAR
jgi:hypothetical protein